MLPTAELQNVEDMTNISLYKKIDSLDVKSLGGAKQSHFGKIRTTSGQASVT